MKSSWDVIIVGAGLSGGLLAYRCKQVRPELSVLLLEKAPQPAGHHTWSFHRGDISSSAMEWLTPFISHSWPAHQVAFPRYRRTLHTQYFSLRSETFRSILSSALGGNLRCGAVVESLKPHEVVLHGGEHFEAKAVVDARGFSAFPLQKVAYQKFIGWDVTLTEPHHLDGPILMDATVTQEGGFRFLYVLPWNSHQLLIEDTCYCDNPDLDPETYQSKIAQYAASRGWKIASWDRQEQGALPIPLVARAAADGRLPFEVMQLSGVPSLGVGSGLFHPTTGYSLPDAVDVIDRIVSHGKWQSESLVEFLARYAEEKHRERGFFRLLNRMLFRGAVPEERYRMLQHFYRLPEAIIERFYASRLSSWDIARVLWGKPPVSLRKAMWCLSEKGVADV